MSSFSAPRVKRYIAISPGLDEISSYAGIGSEMADEILDRALSAPSRRRSERSQTPANPCFERRSASETARSRQAESKIATAAAAISPVPKIRSPS